MSRRQTDNLGDNAVSLFATSFVLISGFFVCASIVIISDSDPLIPLLVSGGIFLTASFLLWMLRDKPKNKLPVQRKKRSWFRGKNKQTSKPKYRLERRGNAEPMESHAPPSAESVRQLKDGTHNWVPSNVPHRPRNRKS